MSDDDFPAYDMNDQFASDRIIYKELSYKIIGCCFEVFNTLGKGFTEVVYKDALSHEFKLQGVQFSRETGYLIPYKDIVLERIYICDFVIEDKIVLEIKAQEQLVEKNAKQLINYLAVTKCRLGILINFGESSLKYKRYAL